MARTIHRLTDRRVKTASIGLHHDGGGLYLQVTKGKQEVNRSWLFRFSVGGKERQMGLGSLKDVSLARARRRAVDARELLTQHKDPITERDAQKAAATSAQAKIKTFDQCRDAYIAAHRTGWRNKKHADQWTNTLTAYASPVLCSVPVQNIDVGLVMKVIEPIWYAKTETASRVRGRIENILDWAAARKLRSSENPARWRGHLDKLLPRRSKVQKVRHHPALPYKDMASFWADLRSRRGVSVLGLRFTILTTARTNEATGAKWSEIDARERVWIVPPERMKREREHRVPLSKAAFQILERAKDLRENEYIFPGAGRTRRLSNGAFDALLEDLGYLDKDGRPITTHGFRSTFKDWARDCTNFDRELSEAALAHGIGDDTEAAYARGDMLEKRRRLMEAWAQFCAGGKSGWKVIPMRGIRTNRRG